MKNTVIETTDRNGYRDSRWTWPIETADVVRVLKRARIPCTTESTMQQFIAGALKRAGYVATREAKLNARDRVDFLVDDIAIECKIGGSSSEVLRQLGRYAESPRVGRLILVTSRPTHSAPDTINGKTVTVVLVGGGF